MNRNKQHPLLISQCSKRQIALVSIVAFVILVIFLFLARVLMKVILIDASQKGNIHIVSLLLKAGANPNADDEGQTPLIMAVEGQHLDTVRLLIAQGANVERRGAFGDTPLTASAGNNDTAIVAFLLDHGANVNAQDASGKTLLMEAASNAEYELVQILLAHHANVNLYDMDGQTALMQAASVNYPVDAARLVNTVQVLIDHGTNIDVVDNHGQTALMLAQRYKHSRVVKMIEQANRK